MRIHVIQHVPFEGPALVATWATDRGHALTCGLALTEEYPPIGQLDFVVVMGGPMAADDEVASPWLHAEKRFLAEAVSTGRLVLGVCLGAQILAEVLGATVRRNPQSEIGWYTVERTQRGADEPFLESWPDSVVVGQWHGDTFDVPADMEPILTSEACANQAFVFDRRVVGLQFHLEWTAESVESLIAQSGADLQDNGMWVMSPTEIVDEAPERTETCRGLLFSLLDAMAAEGPAVAGQPR